MLNQNKPEADLTLNTNTSDISTRKGYMRAKVYTQGKKVNYD
jgi:hypothetical protein